MYFRLIIIFLLLSAVLNEVWFSVYVILEILADWIIGIPSGSGREQQFLHNFAWVGEEK